MKTVQFSQAISGREHGEVAELDDGDAEFLIQEGYAHVYEGAADDGEVDQYDEDPEPEVDVDERANHHSGKQATPLPTEDEEGEPIPAPVDIPAPRALKDLGQHFDGNPFSDEAEQGDVLDGMKLNELRSYVEQINTERAEAGQDELAISGNKEDLKTRIRDAQADS